MLRDVQSMRQAMDKKGEDIWQETVDFWEG